MAFAYGDERLKYDRIEERIAGRIGQLGALSPCEIPGGGKYGLVRRLKEL